MFEPEKDLDAMESHEWDIDAIVDLEGEIRLALSNLVDHYKMLKKANKHVFHLERQIKEGKKTIDDLETKLHIKSK